MSRPVRAVVDLDAIRHNCDVARSLAPRTSTLAVVKANAYGHGALQVARALAGRVDAFGVASIDEALELRLGGISTPIVLLEGFFSQDELGYIDHEDLTTVIHSRAQAEIVCKSSFSRPIDVWLKMDSGMHRLGLASREFKRVHELLKSAPHIGEIVLMTHFAEADDLQSTATMTQFERFRAATSGMSEPTSLANSPAILQWSLTHGDWIRPGLMLYGISPFPGHTEATTRLRPAMRLSSRIIAIRELSEGQAVGYGGRFVTRRPTKIGVVAIGYGDGYPRGALDGTPVLVGGTQTEVIGQVSMDMLTVDLSTFEGAEVGEVVELWGPNLDVNEVANAAETISYELLARMTRRVPLIHQH